MQLQDTCYAAVLSLLCVGANMRWFYPLLKALAHILWDWNQRRGPLYMRYELHILCSRMIRPLSIYEDVGSV
jgi:hypothetical protein